MYQKITPVNIRDMDMNLNEIREKLLTFRRTRDSEQFHDPKNLAEAISIEAGELLQNFLWKTNEGSREPTEKELRNITQEIADIFIYLIYLSEEFDVDIAEAVKEKIKINEGKYPVSKSKGTSKKYTEFDI